MKSTMVNLAGAAVCGCVPLFFGANGALAASPAYCALYAREYTAQFATGSSADAAIASEYKIQEQAYYQCLNLDVEPEFPESSVYHGEKPADVLGNGVGGPYEAVAEGDTGPVEPEVTVEPEATTPEPTETVLRSSRGSGLEPFTPEWEAWCKEHFPNSFDTVSGLVRPFGEEPRICR